MRLAHFAVLPVTVALVLGLEARRAEAHSVPRLYTALTPSALYDPLQGHALLGGGFLLGLGVDPEVDALLVRGDIFAGFSRGGGGATVGFGGALLYRRVVRQAGGWVWTWALGAGAVASGEDDVVNATFGARGELGVRWRGWLGVTAFAIVGPSLGRGPIPVGTPLGLAIELGAP